MDGFLRSCSAAVKGSSGIHVVLGNEACDLDSMVSSLAYAYFLSRTSVGAGRVVVPVMNIPRAEFPLRSDCVFLLREGGASADGLLFRDELDLAGLHGDGRLALTLVNHNVLPSDDRDLEGSVVEVIDHHPLEAAAYSAAWPVAVETVGSCATLVTERIHLKAPEVLDRQLALLLYSAILLDCANMAPAAGRATPRDGQMTRLLEERFPDLPPRGALFQSLNQARFDLSGLSTEQILMKDMKTVSGGDLRVAVCSVYMSLELFLQRRTLQQELCEFCHKRRLAALVAMTISFSEAGGEPRRQLAVYSSSTLYREEVSRALEHACSLPLSLSPASSPYKDVKAYHQGNALASRKKLLPFLRDFLLERDRKRARGEDPGEELDEDPPSDRQTPSPCSSSDGGGGGGERRRPRCDSASRLPATPMNSLAEGSPLDAALERGGFSHDAVMERFSRLGGGEGGERGRGLGGGEGEGGERGRGRVREEEEEQ